MKTDSLDPEVTDIDISDDEPSSETSPEPQTDSDTDGAKSGNSVRRMARRGRMAVALVAVLAVIACSVWAYLFCIVQARDEALGATRQQVAVDAASDAAVAVLSYKSDTVDADLAAANGRLTGTFADYYRTFTRDVVAPAAKEKKITTTANVVGKAISDFSEDRATVIVFVNQSTTTADVTQPTTTSTTIRIEVERHDGAWLVSKFDPA